MKLYAYHTPDIPKHAGYLKIGETYGNVEVRSKQQGRELNVENEVVWTDAVFTERSGIDKMIHRYLKEQGFHVQQFGTGRDTEWVKCTIADLEKAFTDIKQRLYDEKKQREEVGKQFYLEIRNWFYWTTQENKKIDANYALRLVTRLLFCFFLREKDELVPKELLDANIEKYLKNDEECSYYNGILRNLFFRCINTLGEREYENEKYLADKKSIKNWFSAIPFLNSGLFDEHDNDHIPIGNDYFFSEKKVRLLTELGETCDVYGIVTILAKYQYKLMLDDLLDQAEYGKTVDPEFIGKVFESLLSCIEADSKESRRKVTGSYYTPRGIVDYMINEALDVFLDSHSRKSGNLDKRLCSLGPRLRGGDEYQTSSKVLLQCKILDPACGSGAFLCEAMNIIMRRIEEEKKEKDGRCLTPQERYRTKLKIVRDVIYGVDIQPMAVQITALRFFLSLIRDIIPDKRKPNYGIEPLPNLEIKFVCADTLIPLVTDRKDSEGKSQKMLENPVIRNTVKSLQQNCNQYFMAGMIDRKLEIMQMDKTLRETLAIAMEGMATHDTTDKIATWSPYDQTKSAVFFDPMWMFGIEAFDIVISNPPYVDSETMVVSNSQKRELYTSMYASAVGNWDLFVPFIERGINLCNQNGVVSFIIPNKIISQNYAASIRRIISNYRLIEIRDYSRQNVFPIADVYPITIVLKKEDIGFFNIKMTTMRSTVEVERTSIVSNHIMNRFKWDIFFCSPELTSILVKIADNSSTFGNLVNFSSPCTVSEAYEIKTFLSDSSVVSEDKKLINSGTIDQYVSKWGIQNTTYIKGQYLNPIVSNKSLKDMNGNRYKQSSTRKIIVANMTTALEAFFDSKAEYLAGKSTVVGIGGCQNMLFLTGLLNSKLISIWYQSAYHSTKMSGGALSVTAERINKIPIPNVSLDEQRPIIVLVNKILTAKKKVLNRTRAF